jgi:hypothetical protein
MSSSFAILRTAKLKTIGNVAGSLAHTYRTRETANADPDRSIYNQHSSASPGEVVQALKDRLPEKRRKDAVLGLEFFIGGSPDWFEGKDRQQQDAYFRDAVAWLEKRHGKENVVGWSIHRDESTPHLVAYVVPLDDRGKLNAKQWTGGAAALSRMQTEFSREVSAQHGLERGIEGSKAHHQTIKHFYAQVEQPSQHVTISPQSIEPRVLKKGFFTSIYERPEMVAQRLTKAVQAVYAPSVEAAKVTASERRRGDSMAETIKTLDREKKRLQKELELFTRRLAPVMELAILAKDEFLQLLLQAQERVKAIKLERQKAEKSRDLEQVRQRQPRIR